jgi:hypothetical protein
MKEFTQDHDDTCVELYNIINLNLNCIPNQGNTINEKIICYLRYKI